jgi:hypothetical protein
MFSNVQTFVCFYFVLNSAFAFIFLTVLPIFTDFAGKNGVRFHCEPRHTLIPKVCSFFFCKANLRF